ncbi:hypothetical protein KMW28_07195 [Flammeovirga yaeyamensis]|uniref:Uncharacterized protein n=1 Tax=Flammeovirga yaeyamensis TaxID=367791 RepID=A0AAX1NBG8_9BACT|nr:MULTISPECIES: hypothetical protein [Flammeovirga]ANQ49173.1 hypothetical protein MY04_1799 [Flammeovirga sp. MY04]MBB3697964.1 hypothetical protein [Flammeovirga yaeyamensis]NMF35683.1 hypothetical protein [Flammeovirga yaeyamensis]QWG03363.1 hypothetical protein KMW28_07195 [Flammeovirga yaeyamensis]
MKKLITLSIFLLFQITSFAQTKEIAIMALRSEEHTKVTLEDDTVVFTDHFNALENIEDYDFLALELAESLFHQMCNEEQTKYFNTLFAENLKYQNIIECKGGTILNLTADNKGIKVVITTYPEGEVANEYFKFDN